MFCVIEGPNGAGKTSLINALKEEGLTTLSSPNGTPLAKMLRSACRGTEPWTDIDKRVQFMLFSAARYDEYLRLVHGKEEVIIADRWWTSTYVYQCIYQGIPIPFLAYTVHPEEQIDLVILLDADADKLIERVKGERESNPTHGVCRWTQQEKSMRELADIYRDDLPEYLNKQAIPVEIIDTTDISEEEVKETAKALIQKYGGEI